MKRLIVILLLWTLDVSAQQIPLLSQYMFNPVALNPANTGSEEAFSLVGSYRTQWVGFPGAPKTQSFTAHAPFKGMKAAFGFQLFADQIGIQRTTGIYGTYAYRLKINRYSNLSMGIAGGVNLLKANFADLETNDQGDQLLVNDSPLGVLPDFSLGAHYYTEDFFISFSLPMFLTHEFDGLKFRLSNNFRNYNYMIGAGYLWDLNKKTTLKPSILLKYKPDARLQADFNLMVNFNTAFDLGMSYRTEESLIGLFKFNVNEQFSLMYSFGVPLSPLWRHSFGSHELSIKYNFLYKTVIDSPRFLSW